MAREARGTLVLAHVVEPVTPGYTTRRSTLGFEDIATVSEREAHARLEKLVAATRKRGVRVQAELRAGRPWMEILNVAREHGVEAICLGNSGRSLFERHYHLDTDKLLATNIDLLIDAIKAPPRESVGGDGR